MADVNYLERVQILTTRLASEIFNLSSEERLQRLGLHFMQLRRVWADIHGPIECESKLCFSTSHLTWPKRTPLQGTPRYEQSSKERIGLLGEGREIFE